MKTTSAAPSAFLGTLLGALPLPVVVMDRELGIRRVNAEAAALLARPGDLLEGTPLTRWVVPADLPLLTDACARARETGEAVEGLLRFRTARSRVRMRSFRLQGDPVSGGWVLSAGELASGDEDGAELADLRLRFLQGLPRHFYLEISSDGVIRLARGLDRTHLLDDATARGRRYASLLRDEPFDRGSLEAMLEGARDGRVWRGTQWHRREDGECFLARVYAAPRRSSSHPGVEGLMISGLDIDRSRRESERADRAERAGALGLLAGRAAAALAHGLDEVDRALADGLDEVDRALAEGMDREALRTRLRRAVAPLAELAGTYTDLADLPPERPRAVPPERLVGELEESEVRLPPLQWSSPDLPDSLPDLHGPPRALRRVVGLLLRGMEEELGGEPGPFLATARAEKSAVVLSFARRGRTLTERRLQGVFGPGSEREAPSACLAAAKALAEHHGGRIWALNAGGQDSTVFSLELPRAGAVQEASDTSAVIAPSRERDAETGGTATILVVDDDEAIRSTLTRYFTKAGYEVEEAYSGRSAMAKISGARRPELMVTDLRMLDGSGFWLLDQIERYFPELLRGTVVITGDAQRGREVAERTGCPLITKPFELPALLDQLDRLGR